MRDHKQQQASKLSIEDTTWMSTQKNVADISFLQNPALVKIDKLPDFRPRSDSAYKHQCGHILLIAGSTGMLGAGALAANASLRAGAGLVTWAVPGTLVAAAHCLCMEALIQPLTAAESETTADTCQRDSVYPYFNNLRLLSGGRYQVIAAGSGLPVNDNFASDFIPWLLSQPQAQIWDAGLLTMLANFLRQSEVKAGNTLFNHRLQLVLTPHEGEIARLLGCDIQAVKNNRQQAALTLAKLTQTVVVLKGKGTIITDGNKIAVNNSGNPGLATAGTGDVLTGVIAALLAQGYALFDAAQLGVYLHGLAGDLAAENIGGQIGLIASDLHQFLPRAISKFAKICS